jgi:iron complex outermembrane recepter protein
VPPEGASPTPPPSPAPSAASPENASAPSAGTPAPGAAAPAETPAPAETDATLEQITVTARHRVENQQDVPIAVTAVTARDLEASGNFTIRQVQQQVPSLQILGFNPRNITIQIRGLGTTSGSVNSGIEPGVGVYVNGVFFARPSVAVFDLFDIQSIDVLRGPQGTLFGKNTVAGVIDIQTNPASYTPEFQSELTYGNYNYSQIKLAGSGPIGNSGFAFRLAGIKSDRNGTIYNTTTQENWQDYHNQGVRAELAYRTDDESFKARLIGDYGNQQEFQGFQVTRGVLPTTRADGSVATTRGFYDRANDLGYAPLPIDPGARKVDLNTPYTVNMQTGGASLELDKTAGKHSLTSITGWRFWNWNPSLDGDGTALAIVTQANLPTQQRQWSQELRLASPSGGNFEYTGGLYYFWQRTREVPYNTYGSDAAKWLLGPAFPDAALNNVTQSGLQIGVQNSVSAFANATWHAPGKLDVNGGLRYTYETRRGKFESFPLNNALPLTDPAFAALTAAQIATIIARRAAFAPQAAFDTTTSGGEPSGTLNVLYHLTDDVNAYAGYSRGFKSAGVNMAVPVQLQNGPAPLTFRPEIVNAYELGLKTNLIHRRLSANLALFRSDDHDYQANQSLLVDTATGPILRQYLTNVGDVRSQGVEIDLRAKPVEGLWVTGGFTYDDATFVNYHNGQCPYLQVTAQNGGVCDLSGRPLTGVSKFVYNIAAEYGFPIGSVFGFKSQAYFGGNWSQRTSYYGALNDDPYSKVPGYGLAGASLGIRDADARWDLKFWGQNLFNTLYYVNASVDSATTYTYRASLGDPRFYGLTLRVNL